MGNPSPSPSPLRSATSFLLATGAALIFAGILFLIYASWEAFSPLGRILTALLPTLLLYALAAGLWKKPGFEQASRYVLQAASCLLPLAIGVVYYQVEIVRPLDDRLIFFSFLTALPIILSIEYGVPEKGHAYLADISMIIALAAGLAAYPPSDTVACLIIAASGLIFLLLGRPHLPAAMEYDRLSHTSFGILALIGGLATLPFTASVLGQEGNAFFPFASLWLFIFSAAAFFLLAVYFSTCWQKHPEVTEFYQARQAFENMSPFYLTVPLMLSALTAGNVFGYVALLIVVSIISVTVSYMIAVPWFRFLGWGGLAIAFVMLFQALFQAASAAWPVVLIIGGILLIGIALLLTHYESKKLLAWFSKEPEKPYFGLGIPWELPSGEEGTPRKSFRRVSPAGSCLWIFLWVLAVWAGLSLLFYLITLIF